MSNLTKAKLGLALAGVILFGGGVRYDHTTLRWAGIGLVGVAWAMRFVRQGNASKGPPVSEGEE